MSPAKRPTSGRRKYVEKPKRGTGGFRSPPRKQGRATVAASLTDGSAMTVLGASRVLGVSEKRVRQFIEAGDLEALDLPKADESGKRIPTQITTNSVIALRTKRGSKGAMPPEKVREKLSKPSQVETQLRTLTEQVQALALSLKALEAANSEARIAREKAFELEQRLLKAEEESRLWQGKYRDMEASVLSTKTYDDILQKRLDGYEIRGNPLAQAQSKVEDLAESRKKEGWTPPPPLPPLPESPKRKRWWQR